MTRSLYAVDGPELVIFSFRLIISSTGRDFVARPLAVHAPCVPYSHRPDSKFCLYPPLCFQIGSFNRQLFVQKLSLLSISLRYFLLCKERAPRFPSFGRRVRCSAGVRGAFTAATRSMPSPGPTKYKDPPTRLRWISVNTLCHSFLSTYCSNRTLQFQGTFDDIF